jgi:hypothetical protein
MSTTTSAPELEQRYTPVSLRQFLSGDVKRASWAVEGIWPEGASGIIPGAPKSGKSTLSVELAVTLATGTPLFGLEQFSCHASPARVTYVHQGENSPQRIRKDFDLILQARNLGYMEEVFGNILVNGEPLVEGDRFVPAWGEEWEPDLNVLVNPGLDLMRHEDRRWFAEYAESQDYIFLDPIYMLAGISTSQDEKGVVDLLNFLSQVRDGAGCALVFTHQQTNKHHQGEEAARILGSTYFAAWYEAAVFPRRNKDGTFHFHVDNLREMGETSDLTLRGKGVGKWFYAENAQDIDDSAGRASPAARSKATRLAEMRQLLNDDPSLSNDRLATELGIKTRTVFAYRAELNDDAALIT